MLKCKVLIEMYRLPRSKCIASKEYIDNLYCLFIKAMPLKFSKPKTF